MIFMYWYFPRFGIETLGVLLIAALAHAPGPLSPTLLGILMIR